MSSRSNVSGRSGGSTPIRSTSHRVICVSARVCFISGNYREARNELSRVRVRAQRGSALQQEAVFWSGLTAYQLSDYRQTIDLLSVYLDFDGPRRARALLYRGVSSIEAGDVLPGLTDLAAAREGLSGSERGYAVVKILETHQDRGEDEQIIALFSEETASRRHSVGVSGERLPHRRGRDVSNERHRTRRRGVRAVVGVFAIRRTAGVSASVSVGAATGRSAGGGRDIPPRRGTSRGGTGPFAVVLAQPRPRKR